MQNFKNLKVWQKAHLFVLDLYKHCNSYPKEELFGLTSQIKRSSVSIPANIAEGCGKSTDRDFSRYLNIALGSLNETEYYLLLSKDLEYIQLNEFIFLDKKLKEVKGMLISLIKVIRKKELNS